MVILLERLVEIGELKKCGYCTKNYETL